MSELRESLTNISLSEEFLGRAITIIWPGSHARHLAVVGPMASGKTRLLEKIYADIENVTRTTTRLKNLTNQRDSYVKQLESAELQIRNLETQIATATDSNQRERFTNSLTHYRRTVENIHNNQQKNRELLEPYESYQFNNQTISEESKILPLFFAPHRPFHDQRVFASLPLARIYQQNSERKALVQ